MGPRNNSAIVGLVGNLKESIPGLNRRSVRGNRLHAKTGFHRVMVTLTVLLAALLLSSLATRSSVTSLRGGVASAFDESITTYASDCASAQPENRWDLGGTACARPGWRS